MAVLMEHERQCQKIQTLTPEALALWKQLERYTVHPLHRLKASELFLEVLALQDSGTEVDWPSVFCAITTLTRLDRECLQARLAVGCSELEFRWMLHDRHLYTVHKVPVRFQRCLACMVAKQGPCGDHKATWLCRSRLTDAAPGVDVQNAHCLRPSRQRAYQMTDPHKKKSSSSGPGQDRSELISMYDSQTWPETRRSETFHSQAAKLWEFVTEQLGVDDPVKLWEIVSRAGSKRYLLMMAKLWHRASVPEDRVAMDSYVLHAAEHLPEQATPAQGDEQLPGQPFKDREGRQGSWMYPTQHLLAELRAELDLDGASPEGPSGPQGLGQCRYKRPWHWLPEMSTHPRWCKMVLPKPLKLKRSAQDSLETSTTPLLSQELSRHGRRRRLTSAMTDLLQGNSQIQQSSDDPPYGERRTPARSPPKTRAPSKRAHAKRASELLAAQLLSENAALPEEISKAGDAPCGPCGSPAGQAFLMPTLQDDWRSARFAPHMSATSLSPSGSANLTPMDSNDLSVSPSGLSMSSSLSTNSVTTNLGQGFLATTSPRSTAPRVHAGEAYLGPNPMTDWLPQLPVSSLATHLGQIRSEMQKVKADPVDCMEGLWGFDEFPPVPGNLEANLDSLSLAMDFHGRNTHSNQLDMHTLHHAELSHLAEPISHASNLGWQNQIAAYLGASTGTGPMLI